VIYKMLESKNKKEREEEGRKKQDKRKMKDIEKVE